MLSPTDIVTLSVLRSQIGCNIRWKWVERGEEGPFESVVSIKVLGVPHLCTVGGNFIN